MGRIKFKKLRHGPIFRKIAMGSWKNAKDPSVYAFVDLDMKKTLDILPDYSSQHGVKITPSHLVGRALTYCMQRRPEINGMIRFCRIYLRTEVDLFFQVNIPGKEDKTKGANLSGTVVRSAQKLNLADISKKLSKQANQMKEGDMGDLKTSFSVFKIIPWFLMGLVLDFTSFLIYGLNLDLSFLGFPKDPFGSIMITNTGGLGIEKVLAPLIPYSRVPILITVGALTDRAVVVDKKVEVRPCITLGVTFDHRLMDGIHAAKMAQDLKFCFENPSEILFNDSLDLSTHRKDYL
jgi:pyruvate/2-oxoglutarate dehydrogenase complex dihydrolipoamide acyltransferase (E2) component